MADQRQIVAYSGLLTPEPGRSNAELLDYVLGRLDRRHPRLCYLPTAIGDAADAINAKSTQVADEWPLVEFSVLQLFPRPSVSDMRAHLLAQDVILVEGGSVVNLMALWRAHGLRQILRDCWDSGVLLAGPSAGGMCWHLGGPTDSFTEQLDPFTDGLGLLPYSNGVHDDLSDQPRRQAFRQMVADGRLPSGYATEGGVALHYVGTELREAVTLRPGAAAWWVEPGDAGGFREQRIETRLLPRR